MAINQIHGRGTGTKVRAMQWPLYVWFKKHRCFECGGKLKTFWITQDIYEHSFEARGKGFTWQGIWGKPIKYTFAIFKCKKCGHQISIPQQRKKEKPNKEYYLGLDDNGHPILDDYLVYLDSVERAKKETETIKQEQETGQSKEIKVPIAQKMIKP